MGDGIWISCKHWVSGTPVNFTREYGIPCKHWASGAPMNFTGEYGIPHKHWASGAPMNFTGEYGIAPPPTLGIWCPSKLHQGIRHPLQTLGIWCPSELHWGIQHPRKHWASGAPVNFTGEYGIPCNTKYLMVQFKCTKGILSLRRSSHCTQHIIIPSGLAVSWVAMYLDSLYRIPNKLLSSLILIVNYFNIS